MMAVSLFLVAVGAILTVAVTTEVSGVDIDAVGIILMAIGGIGFLWSVVLTMQANGWSHRRELP